MRVVGSPGSGWRALLTVGAFVAVTFGARQARAAERLPVHLSFVGAPECDDRGALEREVERRTDVVSWSPPGPSTVEIVVRLANGVGRLDSVVLLDAPGRPRVTRAITGPTCEEVIEGTALIIAVLLSRQTEEKAPPKPTTPQPDALPPPTPVSNQQPRGLRWRVGLGSSGVIATGIAPSVLPGVQGFVDLDTVGEGWAPAFRIGFGRLWRSGFTSDGAEAAFGLTAIAATACPLAWPADRAWVLRPCATGSYGSLEASGSEIEVPRTETHPWAGIGSSVRFEVRPLRVLSIELEGGAEAALVRSRFSFDDITFHETSPVVGRFALGISAHIP